MIMLGFRNFAQVKQMLDKTSKRWAAVLAVEGGITLMIAAEPVLYAMTHAKGLDLDDSTETSEAGENASLPLTVNASEPLVVGQVFSSRRRSLSCSCWSWAWSASPISTSRSTAYLAVN